MVKLNEAGRGIERMEHLFPLWMPVGDQRGGDVGRREQAESGWETGTVPGRKSSGLTVSGLAGPSLVAHITYARTRCHIRTYTC